MKNNRQYLGIDIGGTFIKIGVVSENGEVEMRCEVPIVRDGSETVMETLFRGLDSFLREHGLDAADYEGIGVSSAGCIDSASGCIAENGGNVPGWSHTEVTGPLTERYGLPATIANDGNCVALAEAWTGAAKGSDNVVCVVLGTGIGGGIIAGGRLIEGARGYGGEIGHFATHAEKGPAGSWESHYETHASTSALVRISEAAGLPFRNGREVFNAAEAGDKGALAALDSWTDEIAYGLAGLTHIFDPEMIIIGGGVSAQEELLVKPLREKVLKMVMPDFAEGLVIKAAALGNSAGMAGAVKYHIDKTGAGRE